MMNGLLWTIKLIELKTRQHAWEHMTGEKVKDVRLFFFAEQVGIY